MLIKIKIKALLRINDDKLNVHLNMSWSSTSCPCCASRRESRHRSWSLSWSRTSAKNKNQFTFTNVIGCHHQSCNCISAKCLHLYSNWGRVEKEGNILAITKRRNLYGCEYVPHYGQKILTITTLVSKSPNAMLSLFAQTALYEDSPTCNRPCHPEMIICISDEHLRRCK